MVKKGNNIQCGVKVFHVGTQIKHGFEVFLQIVLVLRNVAYRSNVGEIMLHLGPCGRLSPHTVFEVGKN